MKLLVVAATPFEIQPLISYTKDSKENIQIEFLITGVGMVATAFALGRKLSENAFDLVINAGIAGAFDRRLKLGEVVLIKEDKLAELGAEDRDQFISIDDLGFGESTFYPSFNHPSLRELVSVSAITVNKVHGNANSIAETLSSINAQTESMEGAASFYCCNQFSLPCIQIRGISNYVEPRNREAWNIPLAIKTLNQKLIEIITVLGVDQLSTQTR